jgi:hypothetical protein
VSSFSRNSIFPKIPKYPFEVDTRVVKINEGGKQQKEMPP